MALALALAVACSSPEPAEAPKAAVRADTASTDAGPVLGDWLVLWQLSDPENLNPLTSNDAGAASVLGNIMSSLTATNPETLEQVPVLATALPEVSDDYLSYTFELRPDATFSDGKPVTVDDVVFSLKVIKHPEVDAPFLRNYFESVVDLDVLDDRRLRFRCAEPYFRNHSILGGISVLPKHFYDPKGDLDGVAVADLVGWEKIEPAKKERALAFSKQFNEDYFRKVLGAGAYVLEDPARDLVTGERVVLRRRPDFWAPGDALRGDGWVDRLFYRTINNPDAALVSLKARTLDAMSLTPIQHFKQTNTPGFEAGFAKNVGFAPTYLYMGWNAKRPVFAEKEVRQALSQLVDRDRIIERVMLGLAEKVDSPVYRFSKEYDATIPPWSFDPAAAAKKLEDAGWKDQDGDGIREKTVDGKVVPLEFEIVANAGNTVRKNIGLIAVDEFRRVGIDATFRELDWTILLQRLDGRDYDAVIIGWQFSPAEPDLYQIWHSSQTVPGGSNHVGFVNEEADRLLVAYRREFDREKRIEIYRRVQEIIHDEAPYTFLFMPKGVSAYDRRFRGVRWFPTGGTNNGEWWASLAEQRYGR